MELYLLVDFGSTYTKLTAVDLGKRLIFIATFTEFLTVATDIHDGISSSTTSIFIKKIGSKKSHFLKYCLFILLLAV